MNDRELLELSAKAAGVAGHYVRLHQPYGDEWISGIDASGPVFWNPLEDDGDALRLAVKLGIEFKKPSEARSVGRVVQAWYAPDGNNRRSSCAKVGAIVNGCRYEATRRAIVLAAAEIGKAMP